MNSHLSHWGIHPIEHHSMDCLHKEFSVLLVWHAHGHMMNCTINGFHLISSHISLWHAYQELQLMYSRNMVPQSAPTFGLMWAVRAWEPWLLATFIPLVPWKWRLPRIILPTSSTCKWWANVSTLLCLATAFSIWINALLAFGLKSNEPIQW